MNEEQWLSCTELDKMLDVLKTNGQFSQRKARLFAVAVCRRIWHLLTDERSQMAVEVAERYADGLATQAELRDRSDAARDACDDEGPHDERANAIFHAACAAMSAAYPRNGDAFDVMADCSDAALVCPVEDGVQAALLRDIFGSLPFRPLPPLTPGLRDWHDGLIVRMAEAIYEKRSLPDGILDVEHLAVLADALEEAGCSNADLLDHLRGPGPHVRGCWAMDRLVNKE
jgi:hypothetical protein